MKYADITGWGKCLPPAVLTNTDLSTILDTDDEWIVSRTGMQERRISHVELVDLCVVAARRAMACANVTAEQLDLIVLGTTTPDTLCPNVASGVQKALGAWNAGCVDVNTACTGFTYGLSMASNMIKTGSIKRALVIGGEVISRLMDWTDRSVAVLFGDGAGAVVIEASDEESGVIGEKLGCSGDVREILEIKNFGGSSTGKIIGDTEWQFVGPEIFKRAVLGMGKASEDLLAQLGFSGDDIDLIVPHQANLRIIDAVAKKVKAPEEKVFINVQRYGNMSAATIIVALNEAIEEGRVKPGSLLLLPAFGAGLTWTAQVVRWGRRVTPLSTSDAELPPCEETALELIARKNALVEASKPQ